MISSIFKILGVGLSLWDSKEKNKYIDEMIRIKKAYYEEYNKENVDDAILDNLSFELRTLCESFSSQVGASNTKD